MIQRLEEQHFFNPVQEHLRPEFEICRRDARTARVAQIIRSRYEEGCFDPIRSRALVFVTSRRRADAVAQDLETSLADIGIRCGSFHARMSAEARESRYQEYRNGNLHLLVATKAFGMGIDIPNIHLLVHYEPPAALEDYLQEVGRAGRDRASRAAAGFDAARPIPCILMYEEDDFRRKRDQLHSQRLTRQDIDAMRQAVIAYANAFGIPAGALFHLPDDFLRSTNQVPDNDDNAETRQRLLLHWLERLRRVSLGYRVPAYLEFAPVPSNAPTSDNPRIAVLVGCVRNRSETAQSDRVAVDSDHLRRETGCRTIVDLFDLIAHAQRSGLVRLLRDVRFGVTHLRRPECNYATQTGWANVPTLASAHAVIGEIVKLIERQERVVPRAELRNIAADCAGRTLRSEILGWIELPKREDAIRRFVADMSDRQSTYLRLLQQIPGFTLKTEFLSETLAYRMRYRAPRSLQRRHKAWLEDLKTTSIRLLREISSQDEGTTINVVELINKLELDRGGLDRLERAAMWLKGLGYIQLDQPLIPFALEARINSEAPLDYLDERGLDVSVLKELQETNRLKELRLFALWALTALPNVTREDIDTFIGLYFGCADVQDVLRVIEVGLGNEHPLMHVIRDRALEQAVEILDDSQKAVFEASETSSLVVFAGPGSGKTHTLLLRVARLVHDQAINVRPDRILVLAYNNAVVTELRQRLRDLFNELGYKSLIGRLRVDTFHSFVRYILRNRLEHVPENEVTALLQKKPYLIRLAGEDFAKDGKLIDRYKNKGEASYKLPVSLHVGYFNYLIEAGEHFREIKRLEYVFVDEFQDITQERYTTLKYIADPVKVHTTVIGDDDQSVYGYDRKKQWARTDEQRFYDAMPFFKKFKQDYQSEVLSLKYNYRSLPDIVTLARSAIELNYTKRLKGKECIPVRLVTGTWPLRDRYAQQIDCEILNGPKQWIPVLEEMIQEPRNDNVLPRSDQPYLERSREIAILFREHRDLYLGYAMIREQPWAEGLNISIHSRLRSFSQTREVMFFRYRWRQKLDEPLPASFLEKFREQHDSLSRNDRYQLWSRQNLQILCTLIEEFCLTSPVGATFQNLHNYITEMDQSASMGKLLQRIAFGQEVRPRTRIILMTLHQSKGLEFDAVLIPPFASDLQQEDDLAFEETIKENRRLIYVGLSRARDRMVWFCGPREQALGKGKPWRNLNRERGIDFREEDEGKVFLSKCASDELAIAAGLNNAIGLQRYLERQVSTGDLLRLERRQIGSILSVCLVHDDLPVAQVSKRVADDLYQIDLDQAHQNLYVANVLWKEYSQDDEYDLRYVSSDVKARGWYYYINFYGYLVRAGL